MATLTVTPSQPVYGGFIKVGYQPTSPLLVGYKIRATVRRNETTETDIPVEALDSDIIYVETRSISTGTAAQRTTFVFAQTDGSWSGGGAEVHLELLNPSDVIEDDTSIIVFP